MHVGLTLLNCLWEQEIVLAVKRGKKLVSNVAILCTITANQKLGMERSNRAVKVSIKNDYTFIFILLTGFYETMKKQPCENRVVRGVI